MSKVRVYELAKEYGIKGPDLAKMLKEHGFEKVKSHMAVLDDATALHARAVIEAQGISAAATSAGAEAPGKPRKKKLPGDAGDDSGMPAKKALPTRKALPEKKALPARDTAPATADETPEVPAKKSLPKAGDTTADEPAKMDSAPTASPGTTASDTGKTRTPEAETPESSASAAESAEAKKPLPQPVSKSRAAAKRGGSGSSPVKTGTGATHDGVDEADRLAQREAGSKPGEDDASGGEAPAAETPAAKSPAAGSGDAGTSEPATAASKESTRDEPAATTTDRGADAAPTDKPSSDHPAAGTEATAPAEKPAETAAQAKPAAADQPAEGTGTEAPAESGEAATPAAAKGSTETGAGEAAAEGGDAPEDAKKVKRLIAPQAKAKVLGRIELPPEAIRDAKRRSAPSTGRNPGSVDRNLRRAALRSTQSRSASGRGAGGRGPAMRRGPGVGGRGRAGGRGRGRQSTTTNLSSTVDPNKVIEITPPISVKALSEAIGVRVNDLIATLTFKLGVIGKHINSFLTNDEVELIGLEVNRNIKLVEQQEAEEQLLQDIVSAGEDIDAASRAPVVTFMGHVDHGKTSLLDALRQSDVVEGEAGGITQHVGAYKITWSDGSAFVVLDTPGHEAFTQMRVRGAKLTDIVVLVVAADDGVMPQTEEAIAHAKAAEDTQIIVAINKCDKPEANPMQVRQQLAVKGLQPEEWGGDVPMIEVSATTKKGLDDLVEQIMLRAEVFELTAKPDAPGEAVVIESRQTPEQGVTVDVLVTNGTLRVRDQVLCGESLSRIRGIIDDHGNNLDEAPPSTPCRLLGVDSLPTPGDKLFVVNDKKKAKEVIEDRERHARNLRLAERSKASLEALTAKLQSKEIEEIKIILKADVMGSLEPIRSSLARLDTEEVKVNVIHSALGGITETDVSLAEASGAMIIGFNSVADSAARQAADRANVDIRFYGVIYELVDDVKKAMEGRLKPEEVEEPIGTAEIRAVFRSSKFGNIAGCYVTDGVIRRNANVRLVRDGAVVYSGTVASLRREKEDAREVRAGFECGLTLKDYNDIKEGDELQFHEVKYVKRTLD